MSSRSRASCRCRRLCGTIPPPASSPGTSSTRWSIRAALTMAGHRCRTTSLSHITSTDIPARTNDAMRSISSPYARRVA